MQIERIYTELIQGHSPDEFYGEALKDCSCDVLRLFNELSLLLARRYLAEKVSYEQADGAMNYVWGAMLAYVNERNLPLVEPCYAIFCAFDEGEYDHHDGADPVEKYTVPMLRDILKD